MPLICPRWFLEAKQITIKLKCRLFFLKKTWFSKMFDIFCLFPCLFITVKSFWGKKSKTLLQMERLIYFKLSLCLLTITSLFRVFEWKFNLIWHLTPPRLLKVRSSSHLDAWCCAFRLHSTSSKWQKFDGLWCQKYSLVCSFQMEGFWCGISWSVLKRAPLSFIGMPKYIQAG